MKKRIFLAVLVLAAFGACKTTSEQASSPAQVENTTALLSEEEAMELGRELSRQFLEGEIDSLWARMSAEMKKGLQSSENLATFQKQFVADAGEETEVVDERVAAAPPHQVYLRTSSFSKKEKPVLLQWALDPNGIITGFFVRPVQ